MLSAFGFLSFLLRKIFSRYGTHFLFQDFLIFWHEATKSSKCYIFWFQNSTIYQHWKIRRLIHQRSYFPNRAIMLSLFRDEGLLTYSVSWKIQRYSIFIMKWWVCFYIQRRWFVCKVAINWVWTIVTFWLKLGSNFRICSWLRLG